VPGVRRAAQLHRCDQDRDGRIAVPGDRKPAIMLPAVTGEALSRRPDGRTGPPLRETARNQAVALRPRLQVREPGSPILGTVSRNLAQIATWKSELEREMTKDSTMAMLDGPNFSSRLRCSSVRCFRHGYRNSDHRRRSEADARDFGRTKVKEK
jgi:hypothetical protein